MSGQLDPDATGSYEQLADFEGYPAYKHLTKQWYLWTEEATDALILSASLGGDIGPTYAWWSNPAPTQDPVQILDPEDLATGTATVSFA